MLEKVGKDSAHSVDRDGETDTDTFSCPGEDGGVDANDFTSPVQQGPPAVSRINGRVGLNDIVDEPKLGPQGSLQ